MLYLYFLIPPTAFISLQSHCILLDSYINMPRVSSSGSQQSFLPAHNGVEPSPSSATSLPRLSASSSSTPKVPAPTSLRSSSLFLKKSTSMLSPNLSPMRRSSVADLPTAAAGVASPQIQGWRTSSVRAAESGKGSLLPDFASPTSSGPRSRTPPNRFATRSSPSLKQVMNLGQLRNSGPSLPQTQQDIGTPKSGMLQAAKQSLRRRAYSAQSDDEGDFSVASHGRLDSPYRARGRKRAAIMSQLQKLGRMKLGHILQVVIVLAVTALVWESHHKALFAAEQLSQFKEEESLLLLHLQRIEQQSIQLHENLSRLAQSGVQQPDNQPKKDVDYDLIHKQTQQLYQMEEELNNEVHALQTRIQHSARNHIIAEFGEGPVQVILELDFGDGSQTPHTIHILLWHDTPHASWTWLEQIGRNVWDGSRFDWQQGHILDAFPSQADPGGGKLEFVETSQHGHEAWTVGLRESPENGQLTMYVNLQDNSEVHKHETCVGKVIDGFDTLQKVLEAARSQQEGDAKSVISVKKATATHVTKKEYS